MDKRLKTLLEGTSIPETARTYRYGVIPKCNCYNRAPTVPTYRNQFTHLPDCPCHGMHAMPVGVEVGRVDDPVTISAASAGDSNG